MLRVESLDAFHGLFQALFGVTMAVAPGETVALIGANGAGKTTLLRALAGALPVRSGSIVLDGVAIGVTSEREQLARGIALVPEGRRLFPSLSVYENLQLAAANGRPGEWTIQRVLDAFPVLTSFMDRPATALSGGDGT